MTGLRAVAGVLLCAALATHAAAQQTVQPGGIATVIATTVAPAGADSVRFSLDPADGLRAFGRATGSAAVAEGGELRLPFTFGLPGSAPAGRYVLGRLRLDWSGGGGDTLELAVDVAARRGATFWIGAETVTAVPGQPIEVGYRVRNRGNAPDSFRVEVAAPRGWTARILPPLAVLAPGDTAAGTVQLVPPETAGSGEEHVVRVGLVARDVQESRSFQALVVGDEGWLGNVAHVPGTLFVGSSSDAGGMPGVALAAAGEVRPGTRVTLALRHVDEPNVAPAFRTRLAGPRVRVGIETPSWDLRVGDLFTATDVLSGPVSQGRGAELELRRDALTAGLFVAAPLSYGLSGESGLILKGNGALETSHGRFGLKATALRRDSELFGEDSRAGAVATWALRAGGHDVAVEAGLLTLSDTSAESTGFAGQARWLFSFDRGSVTARLRKVPAGTRSSAGQGNEAFLSGSVTLSPEVTGMGWVFGNSSPYADGSPHASSRGGAAGVRLRLPRNMDGELLGTYRESWMTGGALPTGVTRAVRASLDVPLGSLSFETDAELGTTSAAETRPYRQIRTGARWAASRQWAWAGLAHYDLGTGTPYTALDLAGALVVRGVELQGGMTLPVSGGATTPASFWSGAQVPVTREIRLSVGVDRRPSSLDAPWRLSLGISRSFGLPLPIARQPVLRGLVFEDFDGDRTRDNGEPLLDDVGLLLGPLRTRTDAAGEFRFYDAARGGLRLDPGGLPPGFVVPAEVVLPTSGYVEIPVIRTATLDLRIFLDRDGDREKDDFEEFADGAVVSIRDARGRTRDAAADSEGRVRFGSLAPGAYTILIYPQGSGREDSPPVEVPITLEPGASVGQTVAVPLRRREIRTQGGSRMNLSAPGSQGG